MFMRRSPTPAFHDCCESREVVSEFQRLEHQRWRLAEILDQEMVSREMADHLRRRLGEIDRRLSQIIGTSPVHGRFLTPGPAERREAGDVDELRSHAGPARNAKGWSHHATAATN
jgi:hypothetical protein